MTPFDLAETYRNKGWTGTLPLGVESKFPPPGGFTGYDGRWPTPDDITGWRSRGFRAEGKHHDASNIALRLPAVAIGLDVNCYEGKAGADELARLVERWGPLPATWSSTSRDDGSRIMFYRVPSGVDPTSWPTGAGPAIEIIRHAHRYAVVWPSVHPETGQPYRWHRPDGSLADEGEVPGLGDLPELPATWLVGLTGYGSNGGHVKPGSRASRRETDEKARVWIAALPTGEPCTYVGKLAADLTGATRREDGNAYDTTRDAVMALLRAGETGHPGVRGVLLAVRAVYAETVADKRGGQTVAEGEFDRFTLGGVAKILDDPSDKAGRGCDCQSGPVTTMGKPPEDPWSDHEPAPVEDPDAEFERRNRYELRVNTKLDELRVLDEARDRLAAEKAAALTPTPFDAGLLEEMLARPAEPPHRVDGLIPSQAGVLVVAQRKVGKTTFDINLGRCLLTGQDFLGRFGVRPLDGRVGFLNYEVSAAQIARWADESGVDRNRFYLVNLRGRRNPFGHDGDRTELAEQLRRHEVEALFVDPFSRAYTGQSQNDPGEVAAWLADLDRFARGDAGVVDIILNAHAGWDGERTRGASALEDWADSMITLVTAPTTEPSDTCGPWAATSTSTRTGSTTTRTPALSASPATATGPASTPPSASMTRWPAWSNSSPPNPGSSPAESRPGCAKWASRYSAATPAKPPEQPSTEA